MAKNMNNRYGFTLVEMLSVISIIVVLAAIIFPVMGTVRQRANQGQCMSNLREIAQGVQQYKMDEGRAPEHLLYKEQVINKTTGLPEEVWSGIYPYLSALSRYRCPNCPEPSPSDPKAAPGPSSNVSCLLPNGGQKTVTLYHFDSYDGALEGSPTGPAGTVSYTLHYCTTRIPNTAVANLGQFPPDYERQLRFRRPPETTVITWCSYHRRPPTYVPDSKGQDIFLWYDGHAKVVRNDDIVDKNGTPLIPADWWRFLPPKS